MPFLLLTASACVIIDLCVLLNLAQQYDSEVGCCCGYYIVITALIGSRQGTVVPCPFSVVWPPRLL
uniref:Secreted peptide n=1 Tax=Arundo donax TaxID=35708 RepID=A0A0A9DJT0_ARUDO